jgi:hypothetical protein
MIPPFNRYGLLPRGIHNAHWAEFAKRLGWNAHRQELLAGMKVGLVLLRDAGAEIAYVDGSFVTAKDVPEDFDVCWAIEGVKRSLLDPVFLAFENQRAAQKARFKGEFLPAWSDADGMRTYLEFFQIDKESGRRKGIIALDVRRMA